MRLFRALVVLLVCMSLPYSAMATMLADLHCHHDGAGVLCSKGHFWLATCMG